MLNAVLSLPAVAGEDSCSRTEPRGLERHRWANRQVEMGGAHVEHDSEIRLDFGGVNDATIASRKLLDFVGAQAGIKWVLFEDKKRLACATLLLRGQLSEASPERASRAEPIFHLSPGYGSFSAVSRSTNRPASASAIPCLKDSGIQESSFSTTNLAIAYPRRFTLITRTAPCLRQLP